MKDRRSSPDHYKIGLVVDRNLGNRISDLARAFHLWVVESPENSPVIQRIWDEVRPDPTADPLGLGVTSFAAVEWESPEESCIRLVGDLEDHHGEYAHDPPWSEIEVFGAKLNPVLRNAFAEIGAIAFEPTGDGFICRR